jgi:hypothetical protein
VCKSVNTKPHMIKIISHARLKICIRRGMQVLKSVNTKLRTIKKKKDIAHTTFHYKYTNKESWGLALC